MLFGVNASGISSKIHSFQKALHDLKPSIFFIQETKLGKNTKKIQFENYQIFELSRKKNKVSGGGLALGVHRDIPAVQVREGDDEVECLSVVVTVGELQFRTVAAYGPQLRDTREKKDNFWNYLDYEVLEADRQKMGVIIEMDSNCWAGQEIIPGDPNIQNSNGKLLEYFLSRHPNLTVVNSLQLCKGLITRQRQTKYRHEKSVLDIFIICEKVLCHLEKMEIDENRLYQLTNYRNAKTNNKVTESDHHAVILYLDLFIPIIKMQRDEI